MRHLIIFSFIVACTNCLGQVTTGPISNSTSQGPSAIPVTMEVSSVPITNITLNVVQVGNGLVMSSAVPIVGNVATSAPTNVTLSAVPANTNNPNPGNAIPTSSAPISTEPLTVPTLIAEPAKQGNSSPQ